MENISSLTIAQVRDGLREKKFSATELAGQALRFAEAENSKTNGYLTFSPELATATAKVVDEKIARGEDPGLLAGVPIGVKDVISTKGVRTTCASRMLEHYIPPYDATAVERLKAAGALIIGKANCDEFAMGSSNENSAFGPVRNPVALDRVPGGSSGGSAAVVAQGTAVASLGSDTGGSIRQPASFCGVVGVTPTYGRISRYGLVAFASSLDHIGPFARNVSDAATVLEAIAGRDELDATSAFAPVDDYQTEMRKPVKGMKIGIPKEYFEGLAAETGDKIHAGLDVLRKLGCEVKEVSLPHTPYAISTYYIICTAEASSNLARYDGVRYTARAEASTLGEMYARTRDSFFGMECKRRIMLGTYVLSHGYYDAYYLKAQKVRSLIAADYSNALKEVDALVAPVSPFPAFKLGEKIADPMQMYLSDIYTITGDLAGIPCMSVPCGVTPEGLPVGMQIFAGHFQESTMFRLAYAFEQAGGVA
ncbi:Asp-tRNA(Asn)/Glu-tRNA(Gln) amidotransferase subunit GatA [Bryobacter aggregatus]|uniref:Asp-tRNA(Asn)/Glu-tRNA(Gln) amidotransferase subunit GatA n=1 Tax=Bryobacter aggregatus TaxID=360054 RepID=UPI0004E0B31D|nr:Asp-tRNA(Asn)/Glu-tRNA(Gln) amidotransferase subunit GatA [Bryobacter aggregatus]